LLLDEVRREDHEAVAVLEAYLDRIHGPEWRSEGDAGRSESGKSEARTASGAMPREEALAMLGLTPDATEAQIREAHHRLMLKLHPDHGGSDYLAARLNEARDVLLGN
jgi:DnaJ-class molecular chaperone with C-terminal Zn finger domain